MPVAGLGSEAWLFIGQGLSILSLLVGLCIAGLAFYGYVRNRSRAMLFLGAGIVTLTAVSWAATVFTARFFGPMVVPAVNSGTQLLGMVLLLVAIVLAQRQ
ncbi:hypothetical protein [Haloarcula amylovorans]|uniref:hypothetical protein n=1 Tax=Haloarcula amylovorans TaxID=2562280 RepID=UPI0010760396|nr:hypothetical protein [Halomicroarcula amylolytica]